MNRLLNGFNYFWDIPPSKQTPANWAYMKKWLVMLKESIDKQPEKEEDLYEIAKKIFS